MRNMNFEPFRLSARGACPQEEEEIRMASELKAAFSPANSKLVDVEEASKFICRCMEATGAPPEHAASLADVLIAGDKRGHYSHGMNRLGMY